MKKLVLGAMLAAVAASLSGCQTCRRMGSWFHRGDSCAEAPPATCPPGVPRATVMYPSSPQLLPGPIEMTPVN